MNTCSSGYSLNTCILEDCSIKIKHNPPESKSQSERFIKCAEIMDAVTTQQMGSTMSSSLLKAL